MASLGPALFSRILVVLLASVALADRFRFSVTNITTIASREWSGLPGDQLFLSIDSVVGDQDSNSSYPLGWNHTAGTSVTQTNLTHDIFVPLDGLNVSVAFAVINLGNETPDEGAILEGVQNVMVIAANIPGYVGDGAGLVDFFMGAAQLFNCSGLVALDSVRYTNETLAGLQIGAPLCNSGAYEIESKLTCGTPNYTVDYCIERLDNAIASASNGAGVLSPCSVYYGMLTGAAVLLALYY